MQVCYRMHTILCILGQYHSSSPSPILRLRNSSLTHPSPYLSSSGNRLRGNPRNFCSLKILIARSGAGKPSFFVCLYAYHVLRSASNVLPNVISGPNSSIGRFLISFQLNPSKRTCCLITSLYYYHMDLCGAVRSSSANACPSHSFPLIQCFMVLVK